MRALCVFVSLALLHGACSSDQRTDASALAPPDSAERSLDDVELGADGRPRLCERARTDRVSKVFCAEPAPEVDSLAALQQQLGLVPGGLDNHYAELYGASAFVTLLGHSTSLSGARISPLNPRMIVIGEDAIMAFERGAQRVEVVTRAEGELHFYLFRFAQACNDTPQGCNFGALYTRSLEQDWLRITVQDDEDLANTAQDCRQCHQRASEYPQLLMRELESPWTHFFQPVPESSDGLEGPGVQGHELLQDYLDAKGDEPYGGFRADQLERIAPFILQSTVPIDQPVLFDAPGIENERFPYDPDTGYPTEPARSRTWEQAYEAWKRGDQLALPYFAPRASDLAKQAALSDAYARYRAGELPADALPDLADVFPDDPSVRAQIGLQTEPEASAVDTLIQGCGSCHNDVLDQTLSRARFNINLWRLDRAEIERAIQRVERAATTRGAMPPPGARQLDPSARQLLLDYLREDPLQLPADLALQRAARVGMTGGKERRAAIRR